MSLCTQSRQLGGGLDGLQLRCIQSTLHSICDRGSVCLELRLGSGRLLRSSLFPCLCVLLVIFFLGPQGRVQRARAARIDGVSARVLSSCEDNGRRRSATKHRRSLSQRPGAQCSGGGGKSPVARRRRHATASSDILRSPRGGGAPSGASSRGRARHRARRLTSSPPLPPPSGPLFAAATETASTSAAAVAAVGAVAKLHGIVVRPADVRSGGHSAGRAGRCDGHAIRQGATNARCASPPLQLVRRRRARAVVHERRRRRRRLSWRRRRALSTRKPQARHVSCVLAGPPECKVRTVAI